MFLILQLARLNTNINFDAFSIAFNYQRLLS